MKLKLKKIDLKENTLRDISSNNYNCQEFINYIIEHLKSADDLLDCKLDKLSDEEFYSKLSKIFDFIVDEKDYLRFLSLKFNKHYTNFININTNMIDGNGYNIEYTAAVISKYSYLNGCVLDLNTLRNLINKYDLLVINSDKIKRNMSKKEKYENHQFINIDIKNSDITANDELFLYFINLLKKDILVKDILYDIKLYIDELMYQVKFITDLSKIKNDDEIAKIGLEYKNILNKYFNDKTISKKRKISVSKHKKRNKYRW